MRGNRASNLATHLQTQHTRAVRPHHLIAFPRTLATSGPRNDDHTKSTSNAQNAHRDAQKEKGAMSRRLEDMAEETIDFGGPSAARNVAAAGFSEDLKRQLEGRIADSTFRSQNQRAFAETELPVQLLNDPSPSRLRYPADRSSHPLERGPETKPPPNHGRAQSPFTTRRYVCSTTVTSDCGAQNLFLSLSPLPFVLQLEKQPPAVNASPAPESSPPSTRPRPPTS